MAVFWEKNNHIIWQLAVVMGGVALFLVMACLHGEKEDGTGEEQFPAEMLQVPVATAENPVWTEVEMNAGIAAFMDTECPVYTQDEIPVTNAEILYGANKEVLTHGQRRWREMQEEFGNIALTTAGNYVNVRQEASTEAPLVGKAYTGTVVTIQEIVTDGDGECWYHVISGQVEGYVSAAFFRTGETLVEELALEEGYLSEQYIRNREEWRLALTLEEDEQLRREEAERQRAIRQADQETIEKNRVAALEASQIMTEEAKEAARNGDTSLLRAQMIEYANQFLGNRYISGGTSLQEGTDCSGFTCFIYRDFGYTIDRTPAAQYQNAGRSISLEEARPGDIICYGKSSVTHVALYMGNGKIIHSANSRKGVVIYDVGYDNIIGVKSILD